MRHRSPLPHAVSPLLVFALATACAPDRQTGTPSNQQPALAAAAPAASPTTINRVQGWPQMAAWTRGERIDRHPTMSSGLPRDELVTMGAQVFSMYCVNCHGHRGRGDGPRAPIFSPRPRDLTRGVYKFRSTPSGVMPSDDDLFATITGGLHGTGMPAFADLPEAQRWAVVSYLRSIAPQGKKDQRSTSLPIPQAPAELSDRVRRGKEVYRLAGCVSCHGKGGAGDGPSASTLKDDRGRTLRPPNFATQPLKQSDSPRDLFRRLITGLDGTPMPSYRAALSDEEIWALVAYVGSLRGNLFAAHASERDVAEARAFVTRQAKQAEHAVAGGCGCQARGR